MELIIRGASNEIADLVLALQGQQCSEAKESVNAVAESVSQKIRKAGTATLLV